MATREQRLSPEQKELVAVGASVGAGCHPCLDHHLKAGTQAGLDDDQLLAAATSARRVTAEAAVLMGDHVRAKAGQNGAEPAVLPRLDEALASLGAALCANDATNIERQLRNALDSGATRPQLEQAIETAKTVHENAARIHVRQAERLLDALAVPAAGPEDEAVAGGGCGCRAENGGAPGPGAQPADPIGERPSVAEPANTADPNRSNRSGPGCGELPAEPFGLSGSGEITRIAGAMANCRPTFQPACPEPAAGPARNRQGRDRLVSRGSPAGSRPGCHAGSVSVAPGCRDADRGRAAGAGAGDRDSEVRGPRVA